jgi:hypothetical protein
MKNKKPLTNQQQLLSVTATINETQYSLLELVGLPPMSNTTIRPSTPYNSIL